MAIKYAHIAMKLREFRKEAGMTPEQLGAKVNRSGKTIEAYETGTSQPNGDMLIDLCKALGKPISAFFPPETRGVEYSYVNLGGADAETDHELSELVDIYGSITEEGRRQLMIFARGVASTYAKNSGHTERQTA